MTSTADRERIPRGSSLGAGIVTLWLVLGAAAVVTAVLAVGWWYTVWIWAGSLVGLGLVLLPDISRIRRRPDALDAADPNR